MTTFGPNDWLVDEMYEQYQRDPESVSESWREYFSDYRPDGGNGVVAPAAVSVASMPKELPSTDTPATEPTGKPIRGAAARCHRRNG